MTWYFEGPDPYLDSLLLAEFQAAGLLLPEERAAIELAKVNSLTVEGALQNFDRRYDALLRAGLPQQFGASPLGSLGAMQKTVGGVGSALSRLFCSGGLL